MGKFVPCIDGNIYIKDDGTMECHWLDPYIGDITEAEWHKRGTALNVRRGCQYCYDMLEWRTKCKEEGWNDKETVCEGYHPDWPGEICFINKVIDTFGKLIGYEVQHKLYSSLHELEFYGWELQYSYHKNGKQIYESESSKRRCGLMAGCGSKEAVSWCSINHEGLCSLDTAGYEEMDRLADRCGFIRVNNRYLLWKYGVPYKEFICGNCDYHYVNQHSYDICTNSEVEPSTKGITVNGQKEYIEPKEQWSGARACKQFVKRGSEEVAKKTYWTKCGIEFQKSTNADVTGYELKLLPNATDPLKVKDDIERVECRQCPFVKLVEEGYPEPVFKRFECRAGSQPPNHNTEWRGSLEDKNTLNIHGLDHELMEEIREYCINHPELWAAYNADYMADCRRTLSISCSANKKGIAAKKELVEKFFPVQQPHSESCRSCLYAEIFKSVNHAGSSGNCHKNGGTYPIYIPDSKCKDYTPLTEVIRKHEKTSTNGCKERECPFHSFGDDSDCECLFEYEVDMRYDGADDFAADIKKAVEEYSCQKLTVTSAYEKLFPEEKEAPTCEESQMNTGSDSCANGTSEDGATSNVDSQAAMTVDVLSVENSESCANCYWTIGNNCLGGGSRIYGEKLSDAEMNTCEFFLKKGATHDETEDFKAKWLETHETCGSCEHLISKQRYEGGSCLVSTLCNNEKSAFYSKHRTKYSNKCELENDAQETALEAPVSNSFQSFDYSTVDDETAEFLQEKANRIIEIRIKSVMALGKEFKEAQDRLSNNKSGTFGAWSESLGFSRQTIQNYIQAYNYIVKNFDNIEAAESIQPSLLFAAAKPSAPKELADAVASGDIKTHKQYKELEKRLKEAEERAERAVNQKFVAENKAIEAEQKRKEAFKMRDDSIKAFERDLSNLNQQLDQAKRNGEPTKIKELGKIISDKQQEIKDYQQQIGSLNTQLAEVKKQLKDKPIEVPATKTVEVIPDEVRVSIYNKVAALYEGILKLTETEIQIFIEDISPDYQDVAGQIYESIKQLENIMDMVNERR